MHSDSRLVVVDLDVLLLQLGLQESQYKCEGVRRTQSKPETRGDGVKVSCLRLMLAPIASGAYKVTRGSHELRLLLIPLCSYLAVSQHALRSSVGQQQQQSKLTLLRMPEQQGPQTLDQRTPSYRSYGDPE